MSGQEILAVGGTVITATHRLARQLRLAYDQAQADAGRTAWPSADVLPLDAWLRRTWEALVVADAPLATTRLLTEAESRLLWQRVLADDPPNALDAGVIVPLVAGGWRVCQAWGLSAAELRAGADSEDSHRFARWAGTYESLLEHRGWLDGGALLARLGSGLPAGIPVRRTGFAGFHPWTPAVTGLAAALQAAGQPVSPVAPAVRQGRTALAVAGDETDELGQALRWAGARIAERPDAVVAILAGDLDRDSATLRRTGHNLLAPGWQLQEPSVPPLVLSGGRTLADYAIVFTALTALGACLQAAGFEQASLLLRSVYLAGEPGESAGRARAELALRRVPADRITLQRLIAALSPHAPVAAGAWREAAALAGRARSRQLPPSQWARQFAAWLAAAGWPGRRTRSSEEFQAVEAWQQELEAFAATDDVAGSLDSGTALGLFTQQIRDRAFEPENVGGAVQILSLREAEGLDFDALWICGMTASQWPPPLRTHPLIPLRVQQAAGMPGATPAGVYGDARERLARLAAAADEVVFSWPREQEGAETLPSPLLRESGLVASPGSAPVFGEPLSLHPDRDAVGASTRPVTVSDDPPPPWRPDRRLRGGTRVLSVQAVCPARALVEFRLGGAPLEPPARILDPAMRGNVVHRLLERLYGREAFRTGLAAADPGVLRAEFDALLGPVLDQFLEAADPYMEQLRRLEGERLWPLVASLQLQDAERPPFAVATEVSSEVELATLRLRLRIDRIDRLDAGGELVLDYKTGEFAPGGWKGPRLVECQLPLYAVTTGSRGAAVLEIRPHGVRLRGVGDADLGVPGLASPDKFFREPDLDWEGARTRWAAQLEQLAGEFARGDFRVNPEDRKWATGQFASVTRIYAVRRAGMFGGDDAEPGGPEPGE